MKRHSSAFIIFFTFFLHSCNTPKRSVWVIDHEHVLTAEQINRLDSLYKAHEKITSNEIALVTTPDYGTDTTLLLFAVNFGRKYGIGKKEKNNGVVIVFSRTLHQTRISTGYGTEKVLKDEIAKEIIDSLMIPNFRQEKIFEGLWQGSMAIIRVLEKPGSKIE